ncbi:MAG TPA: valine--tRNA ligase [Jatrophihabitans sp.]|nr:valine--tRNA ligase [Jatrophihabitans sp.]
MPEIPERPSLDGLEATWSAEWERSGVFRFDRTKTRAEVYSIDTPPPTVSGQLHLGTVFGYVQVDAMARYRRMSGREVFYPMGWDDNGLPTERRVENLYGVRCNPTLPYEPDLHIEPVERRSRSERPREVSRRNFLELCERQTAIDEAGFESLFRTVGLSVDWQTNYTTISAQSRRVAQQAFLNNFRRGDAYLSHAPTLWDVDFQTAVAQAEVEDRATKSAYVRLLFRAADGSPVEIDTTRPELLPACAAVVVSPEDERYQHLIGTELRTPLFDVAVPVRAHRLAERDKGTGLAMVCTFGDTTDVTWWRELGLPLRVVLGRNGRFQQETPEWLVKADAAYQEVAGKTVFSARARLVELLAEHGDIAGEPRPIEHPVKYYEKGDRPLEIVSSRQWYIRNGAEDESLRARMQANADALVWHPEFMRARLKNWTDGLNSDWLISRQRFFGVPFPVWYSLAADGEPDWDNPILPQPEQLPVDPQADTPDGYTPAQRGEPNGFIGDPDVMDTWATSSLSPQIVCGWGRDEELFSRTFPMDLRPQGPEIIRTWTFSTMLRSLLEFDRLPWGSISINGWILDPDRKKISKSKGNAKDQPADLIAEFGADGLRYWACHAGQGVDTAIDRGQMKVGRRLATKLLNVSRFVLGLLPEAGADHQTTLTPLDLAMLRQLHAVAVQAEADFERNDYRRSLEGAENFFWKFCDDYVELVKARAYGEADGQASAHLALEYGLSVLQRLFAPFLPFVCEEVWSWWQPGSVHRADFPGANSDLARLLASQQPATGADVLDVACETVRAIRRAKTQRQLSMRAAVSAIQVTGPAELVAAVELASVDLRLAGAAAEVGTAAGGTELQVEVEFDGGVHTA